MATALLWTPGAFATRFPDIASGYGRLYAMQAAAIGKLYDTAGTCSESDIRRATQCTTWMDGPSTCQPVTCCGNAACAQGSSCCAQGTCAGCGEADEQFEAAFPDVDAELDEAHALVAAVHDILADPEVDDVRAAIEQAQGLAAKGKLAAYYVPAAPARALPTGGDAPARCPVCTATVCTACGCCCECVDSAVPEDDAAAM